MPSANATLVESELALESESSSGLIRQPERPRLPIQVPVVAELGGTSLAAEVLGSTSNVLLVEVRDASAGLPPLGTPIRLRLEWDRQVLHGRLAAHGVSGRFSFRLASVPSADRGALPSTCGQSPEAASFPVARSTCASPI